MNKMFFAFMILGFLIIAGGLLYTLRVGKLTSARQSEYDFEISDKVRRHPYSLNPVFLAYIIVIGLVLLYILYLAVTAEW